MNRLLGFLLFSGLLPAATPLAAQSLLDRPPNISGEWIAPPGTVQFNFLHRFVRSAAPERKITAFPTFVIGVGLPRQTQVGFLYSTNSTLSPRYPNEWEFYGRWLPISQDRAHGKIGLLPHCVERGRGIVDVAVASLDGPEATLDRVPLNGPRDLDPIVRLIGPQAAGAILTASASGNQRRSEPNNEPGHHRPLKR